MLGAVIHGMVSLGGGVKSGGHVLLFDILSGKLYEITNRMFYPKISYCQAQPQLNLNSTQINAEASLIPIHPPTIHLSKKFPRKS